MPGIGKNGLPLANPRELPMWDADGLAPKEKPRKQCWKGFANQGAAKAYSPSVRVFFSTGTTELAMMVSEAPGVLSFFM